MTQPFTTLWFVWLSGSQDVLHVEEEKEIKLREDYKTKLTKAVNLDVLKKQREQVQQYVTQLEKQLPSKAEMDALLSDINQAGLGRGLQFELFKPGNVVVKDYYAELPIGEIASAFAGTVASGKVRTIGASNFDAARLGAALDAANYVLHFRRQQAGIQIRLQLLDRQLQRRQNQVGRFIVGILRAVAIKQLGFFKAADGET